MLLTKIYGKNQTLYLLLFFPFLGFYGASDEDIWSIKALITTFYTEVFFNITIAESVILVDMFYEKKSL